MAFQYNDGGEDKLSSIFSAENFSEDHTWREHQSNWALYYHLSPVRKNLLSWLKFKGNRKLRVLELGAGCGAITSGLCRQDWVGEYVAIEGETRRANNVRKRCGDAENLNVINCNFQDYACEEKFDLVLIIGVLEYSGKYIDAEDPYQDFLKMASSFLTEDGKLILAIENQFGHKYLAGFNEDHYGKPFTGVSDYLEDAGIKTFGKEKLVKMLNKEGLVHQRFYYPFPDYKLPNYVFSEEAFSDADFDVFSMLNFRTTDRSHPNHLPLFNEQMFLKALKNNVDLGVFMNSFLLISSKSEIDIQDSFIAAKFNTDRDPKCRDEKYFRKVKGEMVVDSKAGREAYHVGTVNLMEEMKTSLFKRDVNRFKELLAIWDNQLNLRVVEEPQIQEFQSFSQKKVLQKVYAGELVFIPSDFLDLIPNNILIGENKLHIIDQEWSLPCVHVPLNLVRDRGLTYLYEHVLAQIGASNESYKETLSHVLDEVKSGESCKYFELWFQNKVYKGTDQLTSSIIEKHQLQHQQSEGVENVERHRLIKNGIRRLGRVAILRRIAKLMAD